MQRIRPVASAAQRSCPHVPHAMQRHTGTRGLIVAAASPPPRRQERTTRSARIRNRATTAVHSSFACLALA
eukprot:3438217-Pleurochrysis_carterae.AAC.1